MADRSSKKIPVTEREFLWVQDDDKGEVVLHVGPTMVSPTAADRVVCDDGEGGFREDSTNRPRKMIVVGDDQYCVLHNPLYENDGKPNGKFRQGRNEARPLRNGTRAMIPGPCSFHLWPGQRAEVRDAHELGSNQYLVVKAYGEVDKTAPYYDITAKSAGIRTAIAEDVGKLNTDEDSPLLSESETDDIHLVRGQLIVVRGLDTQFYIPPTGVDIVPDTSVDGRGTRISAELAAQLLQQARDQDEREQLLQQLNISEVAEEEAQEDFKKSRGRRKKEDLVVIDQGVRTRQRANKPPPPAPPQMQMQQQISNFDFEEVERFDDGLLQTINTSPLALKQLEQEARKSRLIREAVVLGEKEFCIILDADGKRQVKVGPARVFPGPYDTFLVEGSRNRIYDAYELLPNRALWLRVISEISRDELQKNLPDGIKLEKEVYRPGDEILLYGVNTFFFPFNEIEVLTPHSGEAVIGNNHESVFIEALGIDQKSGIYVRDLETGEARLVRGKQSYLVDPRKEVHITRSVPTEDWNLWIASHEPHKRTSSPIVTPWAVSVGVPHNHAVLATSATGQRVIEGPCVELLEYEEKLVCLTLSTGRPKTDDRLLKTCFLRTSGNRISDMIRIETKDFVKLDIEVSYSVTFRPEARDLWFTHENYVQVLIDHMRSLVRSRSRTFSLMEFWPQIPQLLRDTILGEKPNDSTRPGRYFPENGMHVHEVEVLSSAILDEKIAEIMYKMQRQSVALQIGDREAQEQLRSAQLRDHVEKERLALEHEQKKRDLTLKETIQGLEHQLSLQSIQQREELSKLQEELLALRQTHSLETKTKQNNIAQKAAAEIQLLEAEAKAKAQATLHGEERTHLQQLRELEIKLLEAKAAAVATQHQAVQPGLVEAITSLGDKIMLADVAQNMNLISLFQGKDVGSILGEVLGGTRVMTTINKLIEQYPAPSSDDDGDKENTKSTKSKSR